MASQRGEDGAIGGVEIWPLDATAEDSDLMTQSQNLGVLLTLGHAPQNNQSDHQPDHRIKGREEHEPGE